MFALSRPWILGLTILSLAIPLAASPQESVGRQPPTFVCGGIDHDLVKGVAPSRDDRSVDLGLLLVTLDSNVNAADSAYIIDLLTTILPFMEEIVGPPTGGNTLGVKIVPGMRYTASAGGGWIFMPPIKSGRGFDDDDDGLIDEDLFDQIDNDGDGSTDEDPANSQFWDNVFIHELTHIFHGGTYREGMSGWWIEGAAQAAQYFVSERATRETFGRDLRFHNFPVSTANFDVNDMVGAQVIGGGGQLIDRVDQWLAYNSASAALIIALEAQLSAGNDLPHPMARAAEELMNEWEETPEGEPTNFWEAIDRAWSAPVDGVFPPSRWVRAKSITNTTVRSGTFVYLLPPRSTSGLNPKGIRIFTSQRRAAEPGMIFPQGVLRFTNARGETTVEQMNGFYLPTPELPSGAYLVEGEITDSEGEIVRARNYILITPSERIAAEEWEGVPVVFTDGEGLPVELPDLSVNGTILERVPGGAVIAPLSNHSYHPGGTLRISSGGREVASVTVPGTLPRLAIVSVENPLPDGVVSWTPYHPTAGDSLEVWLRRNDSALKPGENPVEAVFHRMIDGEDNEEVSRSVLVETGDADLLHGRLFIPEGTEHGLLQFQTESSNHEDWLDFRGTFRSYGMAVNPRPWGDLNTVRMFGALITLEFDGPVEADSFSMEHAANPDGPWVEWAEDPVFFSGETYSLAWEVADPAGEPVFYRVMMGKGDDRQILCSFMGESSEPSLSISQQPPYPNPSASGFRWMVTAGSPIAASFEVYDITGRILYGPVERSIRPGTIELQWDGESNGREAGSGVYFLRLSGPGITESRRVMLIR